LNERQRVQKAPLTPFAWCCVIGFGAIVAATMLVFVWLAVELSG